MPDRSAQRYHNLGDTSHNISSLFFPAHKIHFAWFWPRFASSGSWNVDRPKCASRPSNFPIATMSTSVEPILTAEERHLQSLIYGLIISTAILSMIVCGLRVRTWLEGSSNTGNPVEYGTWADLCLQLYTRAFVIKVFGVDDIAVCVALVCPTFHAGDTTALKINRLDY